MKSIINIGDIYCYTNRSIISPSEYKSRRRVSGIGIVIGIKNSIIRVVSVNVHNNGHRYQLMRGDCQYDFPDVNSTIYVDSAFRDINGQKNTDGIRKCSSGELIGFPKFEWKSLKFLKDMGKMYKGENDWYIPSAGEVKMVLNNKDIILDSLSLIKDETLSSLLNNPDVDIISSTQKDKDIMYSVNIKDSSAEYRSKYDNVFGISLKKIRG